MTKPRLFSKLIVPIFGLLLVLLAPTVFGAGNLSAQEAYAAAQAGDITLIDIRTPREWRQTGTAPGAARIDFYQGPDHLLENILRLTEGDKHRPIGLICRTGNRTTTAQRFLQQRGFTQVYNVKEGMVGSHAGPGWLTRKLPTEDCKSC